LNALGGSDEVSYGTGVYNTGLSGGVHTSLLGGPGTDSFTLNATPGPDDDVTLDGQSDSDTYAIHFGALTAPVTINDSGVGPATDNQIIAIGTAGSDNFTITAGQVVFQDEDKRPPQVVVYFGDIGNLKFEGVLGDDTFTVMKLGVPADLIGGGGADTFNILATDAPVTIDGQAGATRSPFNSARSAESSSSPTPVRLARIVSSSAAHSVGIISRSTRPGLSGAVRVTTDQRIR
jgi:hypothetical protein